MLNRLPKGLDENLGEEGVNLSGGEIQRIGLCRSMIYDPEILFLDEASSHLDMANEEKINQHLKTLNITRIMVAHRPQTIAIADTVYHLSNQSLQVFSPSIMEKEATPKTYGEDQ